MKQMKLVDLTHKFSIHTPGWVGYPSPKLSYFQRHATNGIVCLTGLVTNRHQKRELFLEGSL